MELKVRLPTTKPSEPNGLFSFFLILIMESLQGTVLYIGHYMLAAHMTEELHFHLLILLR